MITLTIGRSKKKPNSISDVFYDTTTIQASLKDEVSVESPVFQINFDPRTYNYCSWASNTFTRYYYIKGRKSIHNNLWEISCELDIRATYLNIYRYGIKGRCLYTTNQNYWDEYCDDMRFKPDCLDQWDHAGDTNPNLSYLFNTNNIFGVDTTPGRHKPILWDMTWTRSDSTHAWAVDTVGEGCYVVQCRNTLPATPKGVMTYVMKKSVWESFSRFSIVDFSKYITIANWLPVNFDELINLIPNDQKAQTTVIDIGPDEYEYSGTTSLYQIANVTLLKFNGSIEFPVRDVDHPRWMNSARWNTIQLNAPGGTTELNIDLCYPCANRSLNFQTILDVASGMTTTKYTYDIKGTGFNNAEGTTAYESSYQIGFDALGLVSKQWSPINSLIDAGGSLAPIAGGLIGGPAGTLVGGAAAATFASAKMTTGLNTSGKAFNVGASAAELFNNTQPGCILLRLKPFACRELEEPNPIFATDANDPWRLYVAYCKIYGFPCNRFVNWHDFITSGFYWVLDDVEIKPNGYTGNEIYTEGLTPEILDFIKQDLKKGVWYEWL